MFGHFENANVSSISIYPAIFTRISLALVHSTQDVREYETRLLTGVLDEYYIRDVLDGNYFSGITQEMNTTWKNQNGAKSIKKSCGTFFLYLVEYFV